MVALKNRTALAKSATAGSQGILAETVALAQNEQMFSRQFARLDMCQTCKRMSVREYKQQFLTEQFAANYIGGSDRQAD
ncbi:MAG TPA: hypothetical protein VFE61_03025, partial [Candidatus Sulfotelmatobacter sp.]|nr:hypothetical protein [Candidatus Sulfotelmatobacter sp.]